MPDSPTADRTPASLVSSRNKALELWEKLRIDQHPVDVSSFGSNGSDWRRRDPQTIAWLAQGARLRPQLEQIVSVHPLANALCLLALIELVDGNEQASRESATLASLVYTHNLDHQYSGAIEHVGPGCAWTTDSFVENLWKLDSASETEEWSAARGLAAQIFRALPERDWDAIESALESALQLPADLSLQAPMDIAGQIALSVDKDGELTRRLATSLARDFDHEVPVELARARLMRLGGVIGHSDPVLNWPHYKLLLKERKPEEAASALKATLGADPLMPEALAVRAAQLERDGDTRAAMLHYNAAAAGRPAVELSSPASGWAKERDRLKERFRESLFQEYATGFNELFRSNAAETYGVQLMAVERLRQLRAPDLDYYRYKAHTLARLRRFEAANESWLAYLELSGADRNAAYEALASNHWSLKDFSGCVRWYSQSIANGTHSPEAFHWRGSARVRLGQMEEALGDFEEALKRGGSRPWTHIERARIFAASGKRESMELA